jgi:membrane-associated protein
MELLGALWDFVVHLDAHLAAFVAQHGAWVYALLFVIVFCETGLVVTPFLGDRCFRCRRTCRRGRHGHRAGDGLLVAAALSGDNVNYWSGAGRAAGVTTALALVQPAHLASPRFYERHGGKTIILARFVPIVRTYVPFVAGVGTMPYLRYLSFCILGACVWVVALCLLGYWFGNQPIVKNNLTAVILIIVVISVSPGFFAWLRSRMT